MAKRGMKRGSVCLSPADQRVLKKFDDAIAKLRGERGGVKGGSHKSAPRKPRKTSAGKVGRPSSKAGWIGDFKLDKATRKAMNKVHFYRQKKAVEAAIKEAIRNTPGTSDTRGTRTSE